MAQTALSELVGGKKAPGAGKGLCCARRGWKGDQRLSGSALPTRPGDQTGDVAAGPEAALPPPPARLHTPPTKPSIFLCSTNRLSGIFLRL